MRDISLYLTFNINRVWGTHNISASVVKLHVTIQKLRQPLRHLQTAALSSVAPSPLAPVAIWKADLFRYSPPLFSRSMGCTPWYRTASEHPRLCEAEFDYRAGLWGYWRGFACYDVLGAVLSRKKRDVLYNWPKQVWVGFQSDEKHSHGLHVMVYE